MWLGTYIMCRYRRNVLRTLNSAHDFHDFEMQFVRELVVNLEYIFFFFTNTHIPLIFMDLTTAQQCGQHTKDIDYGSWPAPRNHMAMKQGYEVSVWQS